MSGRITRDRAIELFEIRDSALINRRTAGKARKGEQAGWIHPTGYRRIEISGREYPVHRIVWLMVTGEWVTELDHINGDRLDNRIENLRPVTRQENLKNQKRSIANTSGVTGVYWDRETGKWRALIRIGGKVKTIGRFLSFEEAVMARKEAERKNGYHANHGRVANEGK